MNYEIKNVVFDFTGVIASFDKFKMLTNRANFKDICNLIGFGFSYLTNSGVKQTTKNAYKEMMKGNYCVEDTKKIIEEILPGKSGTFEKVFNNVESSMIIRPRMIYLSDFLRRNGLKTYILSNTVPQTEKMLHSKDISNHFDGIYCTTETGLIKPNTDVFFDACFKWHIFPEESIFIDDKKENVMGAEAAGFKSSHRCKNESETMDYIFEEIMQNNELYSI